MKPLLKYAVGVLLAATSFAGYAQTIHEDSIRNATRQRDSIRRLQEPIFGNMSTNGRRSSGNINRANRVGDNHVAKIGFGALVGMPMGEFEKVAGDITPWGYGINAAFRVGRNAPFFAGFDFGYMGMGRNVDAFTSFAGNTSRIVRRNRIITGHALLRLQPRIGGPIRPYVDGMLGLKYFRTATEIENNNNNNWWGNNNNSNNRNIVTVPNHEDVALSYGGGIGINIVLGENVWLDLRTVYLPGTVASYVKRGDVYPDPNDPARTIVIKSRSATDMLNHQIGLTFSF
ncbi:hypothetical protein [Rhodoflexus sp.]